MPVTIQDIASKLNVSNSTVSRVLNGRGLNFISDATRERVLQAASEMGYRPNRLARALATGRTHTIGLALPEITRSFFANIIGKVVDAVEPNGYDLLLVRYDLSPETSMTWNDVSNSPVDGIIAWGSPASSKRFGELLSKFRVPTVSIGLMEVVDSDYVRLDLKPATADAVRHLIAIGRKRIHYVVAPHMHNMEEQRECVYVREMHSAGMTPQFIAPPNPERFVVKDYVKSALITSPERPDALFCCNDDHAIATLAAVKELGLRIPEDIAVVGCDGVDEGDFTCPPLSTIVQPIDGMVRLAWDFLQRRIANLDEPLQHATLSAEFMAKQSSLAS